VSVILVYVVLFSMTTDHRLVIWLSRGSSDVVGKNSKHSEENLYLAVY